MYYIVHIRMCVCEYVNIHIIHSYQPVIAESVRRVRINILCMAAIDS